MIKFPNALIEQTKDIAGGQPRIKGTGIKVSTILDQLAIDQDIDRIISDFPSLNKEKILAALEHSAWQIREDFKNKL